MSDQPNEYNKEAPPKQGPEAASQEKFTGGGNLVTMYQAQQGANSESFPVLQAFQDYIEAERKQARKRVVQLSISFAVIIGVVVVGFLAAGAYMMQNMTNKLFEVALSEKQSAPVTPLVAAPAPVQSVAPSAQTSPALEASIRQMSQVLAKMQSESSRKLAVVSAERSVQSASALQNHDLDALKAELRSMKAQSLKLEGELSSMRVQGATVAPVVKSQPGYRPSKVVQDALAAARLAEAEKEAQDRVAAEKIAKVKADAEKARQVQIEVEKKVALKIAALSAKAERDAQLERKVELAAGKKNVVEKAAKLLEPRLPVADKVPSVCTPGVTAPKPPKDMMIVSVPLQTKTGGVVSWRVFVPE